MAFMTSMAFIIRLSSTCLQLHSIRRQRREVGAQFRLQRDLILGTSRLCGLLSGAGF